MLGWWRKNEGFEWREYVRTTILVRRKQRRERVEEVKVAAVVGLKKAGEAGAKVGASGLSKLAGGVVAGSGWFGRWGTMGLATIGRAPAGFCRCTAPIIAPLARSMANVRTMGPNLAIGGIGLVAALSRW